MSRTALVSFSGKDCSGCKHLNERGYCEFTACIIPCTVSTAIPEVKPQTNADRIRNMDDYDLAIFLENVSCKHADTESWLDWLKQEGE